MQYCICRGINLFRTPTIKERKKLFKKIVDSPFREVGRFAETVKRIHSLVSKFVFYLFNFTLKIYRTKENENAKRNRREFLPKAMERNGTNRAKSLDRQDWKRRTKFCPLPVVRASFFCRSFPIRVNQVIEKRGKE